MKHRSRPILIALLFATIAFTISPVRAQKGPVADLVLSNATNPLVVYASPALSAQVIDTVPVGGRMVWDAVTVQQADNRNWLAITYADKPGWITPDSQQHMVYISDPSQVTTGLERGATIRIGNTPLLLYPSMAIGGTPQLATTQTLLTVTDGPVFTDLYVWWKAQTSDGAMAGWFIDPVYTLEIVQPVQAYGYSICGGLNLQRYGVLGWDSIVDDLQNLIPKNETVMCLGSVDLKGDKSPVVIILSTTPDSSGPPGPHQALRIVERVQNYWHVIFEQATVPFARTARLSLEDLTNDGKPAVVWTVRNDGTGGILTIQVLRYDPAAGMQRILFGDGLYHGGLHIYRGMVTFLQANAAADEPNCCHVEILRQVYQWQNGVFVKIIDDQPKNPVFLQGIPTPAAS